MIERWELPLAHLFGVLGGGMADNTGGIAKRFGKLGDAIAA